MNQLFFHVILRFLNEYRIKHQGNAYLHSFNRIFGQSTIQIHGKSQSIEYGPSTRPTCIFDCQVSSLGRDIIALITPYKLVLFKISGTNDILARPKVETVYKLELNVGKPRFPCASVRWCVIELDTGVKSEFLVYTYGPALIINKFTRESNTMLPLTAHQHTSLILRLEHLRNGIFLLVDALEKLRLVYFDGLNVQIIDFQLSLDLLNPVFKDDNTKELSKLDIEAVPSFSNSLTVWNTKIYILTRPSSFFIYSLSNWWEYINGLFKSDSFLSAMTCLFRWLINSITGFEREFFYEFFSVESNTRLFLIKEYLVNHIPEYLELYKSRLSLKEFRLLFQVLLFCGLDHFTWTGVFEIVLGISNELSSNLILSDFFDSLVEHITTHEPIEFISNPVLTDMLVDYLIVGSQDDKLQAIVAQMNPTCLNIDKLVSISRERKMFAIIINCYTRAFNDFVSPMREMCTYLLKCPHDTQYDSVSDSSQVSQVSYLLSVYITSTIAGTLYPADVMDKYQHKNACKDVVKLLLTCEISEFKSLGPYPYLQILYQHCPNQFIGIMHVIVQYFPPFFDEKIEFEITDALGGTMPADYAQNSLEAAKKFFTTLFDFVSVLSSSTKNTEIVKELILFVGNNFKLNKKLLVEIPNLLFTDLIKSLTLAGQEALVLDLLQMGKIVIDEPFSQEFLHLFTSVAFHKTLIYAYLQLKDYNRMIKAFIVAITNNDNELNLQQLKTQLFTTIHDLMNSNQLEFPEKFQLKQIMIDQICEFISFDTRKAVSLVEIYLGNDHDLVVGRVKTNHNSYFAYLNAIFNNSRDDIQDLLAKYGLDYMEMMAEKNPSIMYDFMAINLPFCRKFSAQILKILDFHHIFDCKLLLIESFNEKMRFIEDQSLDTLSGYLERLLQVPRFQPEILKTQQVLSSALSQKLLLKEKLLVVFLSVWAKEILEQEASCDSTADTLENWITFIKFALGHSVKLLCYILPLVAFKVDAAMIQSLVFKYGISNANPPQSIAESKEQLLYLIHYIQTQVFIYSGVTLVMNHEQTQAQQSLLMPTGISSWSSRCAQCVCKVINGKLFACGHVYCTKCSTRDCKLCKTTFTSNSEISLPSNTALNHKRLSNTSIILETLYRNKDPRDCCPAT